jgi:nuclease-like protein
MAQISTNEPLIENRKKVGRYASFGGLAIIFGGLLASFQNQPVLAYGALVLGFILSNVGAYYLSRWGLGTHEKLGAALKGLDKRYRLYNYLLPVPNVMLTPYGVTIFLVKNHEGRIVADEKGWRQPTGFAGNVIRFMRVFSSEPLGDPPKELELQKQTMKEFIAQGLGEGTQVPVQGLILFTNPRADVTLEDAQVPTIAMSKQPDALKNALRRDKRTPQLPGDLYDGLVELFDGEAVEKTTQAQNGFRFWRR